MGNTVLTRKELYDLVWSTPFSEISEKYSISQHSLQKVCQQMNIPFPKSSYWEKLSKGKSVHMEELSSDYSGVTEVSLVVWDFAKRTSATEKRHIAVNEIDPAFQVAEKLTNPDQMIVAARESLTAKRQYAFRDGLVYTKNGELKIYVSPDNVTRGLRFMDAFVKIMKSREHKFVQGDKSIQIIINEEKVSFCLRERCKRITIKDTWERTELKPSGVLTFIASFDFYSEVEWHDGRLPIESKLQNIVIKVELKAFATKEYRNELKKVWAARDEKIRLEKEAKTLREKELSNFRMLLIKAKRWKESGDLRDYLEAYESKAKQKGDFTEEMGKWLEWAHKKADWYDPVIETDDELLKNVNRDEIDVQKVKSFRIGGFQW